jgi:minor histocompatibility antigen H13
LQSPKSKGSAEEEEEEEVVLERLSEGDAWLFPIVGWSVFIDHVRSDHPGLKMGSGVLVFLYAVIKFLGREWINWFLGLYFSVTGAISVWKVIYPRIFVAAVSSFVRLSSHWSRS